MIDSRAIRFVYLVNICNEEVASYCEKSSRISKHALFTVFHIDFDGSIVMYIVIRKV
jgi:hypothetical protein